MRCLPMRCMVAFCYPRILLVVLAMKAPPLSGPLHAYPCQSGQASLAKMAAAPSKGPTRAGRSLIFFDAAGGEDGQLVGDRDSSSCPSSHAFPGQRASVQEGILIYR
jgi:hypothetical protein